MLCCSARIDLDRPPTSLEHGAWHPDENIKTADNSTAYTSSQQVVGTVIIAADTPLRAARVTIIRHWVATGHAAQSSGGRDEILLYTGDWDTPGTRQFPFIFNTPCGPYTYRGRLIQVRWMLEVCVESEGQEVTRKTREFVLQPSHRELNYIPGVLPAAITRATRTTLVRHALARGVGLLAVLAITLLSVPAARDYWGWSLIVAASIALLSLWIRPPARAPRRAPLDPEYQVEPGDMVAFLVELKPSFRTEPRRVSARLIGLEQSTPIGRHQRAGKSSDPQIPAAENSSQQLDRHRFFDAPAEIEPVATHNNAPTARNTYRVRCRIPTDAPFSFYCPTACVKWAVEVHVDVGSWPDWHREFPLIVRPGRLTSAPELPGRTQSI